MIESEADLQSCTAENAESITVTAMLVVSQIILAMVAGLVVYRLRFYLQAVRVCLQLKGPPTVFLFGNTTLLLQKNFLTHIVATTHELYGSCVRCWISIVPGFILFDPVDVQSVLATSRHKDKMFVYRFLHTFLGDGLLTTNGARWLQHRRLIQPAFHQRILSEFVGIFARAAAVVVSKLRAQTGVDLNVTEAVNDFVLHVLHEAVFGMSEIENMVEFAESPFRKGKVTLAHRLAKPWLILDWIYSLTSTASHEEAHKLNMKTFTRRAIVARVDLHRTLPTTEGVVHRFCLLDYLLQLSDQQPAGSFTESDVIDEAITFMLAGQDAVGASLACSIFLLAQNAECQRRARQEVEQLDAEQHRTGQPLATVDRLRRQQYLGQCIKESLRLYPSVPLIARELSEPLTVGRHVLPVGSNILIFPYALHRLPKHYPDAERFDPDRFDAAHCAARHPYAYIPFSAGPRKCIGDRFVMLELQTILAALLRNFDLLPVPGRPTTVQPVFRVTLRAAGGLWVRLQARD